MWIRTKILIPEFVENILKYDIVCFTETNMDESDRISTLLPGYTFYLNNRQNKLRPSWDIVIGIKDESAIRLNVDIVHKSEFVCYLNISGENLGVHKNI